MLVPVAPQTPAGTVQEWQTPGAHQSNMEHCHHRRIPVKIKINVSSASYHYLCCIWIAENGSWLMNTMFEINNP